MPSSVHPEDHPEEDQAMVDAEEQQSQQNEEAPNEEQEEVIEMEGGRITVLPGATETAASFQFADEGHTLGNALRYVIMKNPAVELCGYTIPHPSEAKMNLRIQTYDNTTAVEVLEKGLNDLMDLCDVVSDKFTVARDNFNDAKADQMVS